ncbi:MAG: A/G-specific adenine glycosylase [Candidatus Peregrinibacteria bacterium]
MKAFSPSDIAFVQKHLVAWFKKSQRDLPWRKTYNPYHVWISEIMLQQTQVKTVLPYFERWMCELPDISSVAQASEDKVLKLWEGLGYYSRARNIQKAAQVIVEKFNGQFPSRYEDILGLPGVGKYTAGAIASIAFNQNRPLVDGNVIRVIARLLNFHGNVRLPKNVESFWKRAGELLPAGEAREFNQGLMELGAMVCKPQNPFCAECPVQKICLSRKAGAVNRLPNRGEATPSESIQVAVAVIAKGNRVFIQKRPAGGLMPGLWEFPGGKIEKGEKVREALCREVKEEVGIKIKNVRPITVIQHAYTRFKVDLHCFSADFQSGRVSLKAASDGRWVSVKKLADYPFPAANARLIHRLKSPRPH